MALSLLEQEGVILNGAWDAIDSIANAGRFVALKKHHDINLMFEDSAQAALFNILLGDFLSQPQAKGNKPLPFDLPVPPSNTSASNLTYLFYLRQVAAAPQLGGDPAELNARVEAFGNWLDDYTLVKDVWLANIEVKTDIKIRRCDYLRICADIAKHNFARLQHNVRKIRNILAENGTSIDENDGFLALQDFYEWFHRDLFIYHSSIIAEFLNNIRWAIDRYLQPEYHRAYKADNSDPSWPKYGFDVPAGIQDPLARSMYWDLMNRVRGRPCMPEFVISDSFRDK
jgi:hypothetical protein